MEAPSMNQRKRINARRLLLAIIMLLGIAAALHLPFAVSTRSDRKRALGVKRKVSLNAAETQKTRRNLYRRAETGTRRNVPAETQTEESTEEPTLPVEVSFPVRYLFVDGSLYAEYEVTVFSGTVLDGGDLPLLPDAMVFIDDFVFYEVRNDGTDLILRYVRDMTDTDKDGIPDDVDTDDDNDGVNDQDEQAAQLDPKNPDSNADGIRTETRTAMKTASKTGRIGRFAETITVNTNGAISGSYGGRAHWSTGKVRKRKHGRGEELKN